MEIFGRVEVFQLFENMKKNPTPDDFNNYFTNELKMNFIRDVIKNRSVDDGKEKSLLVERILFCKSLYDNVSLNSFLKIYKSCQLVMK